uniref:Uncharacterized protein n=1 Tax=Vibrio tasmaniensis TaxID=212663 RepID=A0A0H4A3C0_9VIBR|nr:hypothetical protein [Vibrio tasmaniensis]
MSDYEFVCFETTDISTRTLQWRVLQDKVDEQGLVFLKKCRSRLQFYQSTLLAWDLVYVNYLDLFEVLSNKNKVSCPMNHELANKNVIELVSLINIRVSNLLNAGTAFFKIVERSIVDADKREKWNSRRRKLHKDSIEYKLCYELRNQIQHVSWAISHLGIETKPEENNMNLYVMLDPKLIPNNNKIIRILNNRDEPICLNRFFTTYTKMISILAGYFFELVSIDDQECLDFILDVRQQLNFRDSMGVVPVNTPDHDIVDKTELLQFEIYDWIVEKLSQINTFAR